VNVYDGLARKAAVISPCEQYRYQLYRWWAVIPRRWVLWVMLNPSIADANIDDPTIRRCIGFSKAWGYDGLMVGNLFAYRTTLPERLRQASDPMGPSNIEHLKTMAATASGVVCGWGANTILTPSMLEPTFDVLRLMSLQCLGKTKSGQPRHPLYVASSTPLESFSIT